MPRAVSDEQAPRADDHEGGAAAVPGDDAGAEPLRGDAAAEEDGDEGDEDTGLADIVRAARDRLTLGFQKGEIDAKTAAQIVLADMRLKEKRRGPDESEGDALLEGLREAASKTFGINRSNTAKKIGKRARGRH